ncbi:TetR/AcrR family transcriptional regulator [Arthrobacter cryoconiti]|uniref:TetR/AcrR family transcriptional regulator n=1 Tax=Arthrobacter cryoconiti TaxID=748907 RepID=A0ABV8R577_9MICC|nr:TetR/AcrR family transcriptional regulator [Arthrobacter cryoconiti]MCC9067892.1 TetR/AcrR family transcriptional regulator [Arthrobacter cryoconiti]
MTLRSDARDNRDRIVDAAEQLYAVSGLATPMSEIARRAGVGAATLSRRFPTRESLMDAVFARQLDWWMDAVDAAENAPDAWTALMTLLEDACVQQAHDGVCADLVVRSFLQGVSFDDEKAVVRGSVERIIRQAQRNGKASTDVAWDDVVLLIEANAGAARLTTPGAEGRARRLVHHFIRSFAAR